MTEMMQQSKKEQRIVLSATVLTLVLGAAFSYFQATRPIRLWPLAVLLGLVWGTIGIWIVRRARPRADADAKK